jgi:hypothetical protein
VGCLLTLVVVMLRPKAQGCVNYLVSGQWGLASLWLGSDSRLNLNLGSYLGPLLASSFLISGLSYKTTFNSELRISSFPLYSI